MFAGAFFFFFHSFVFSLNLSIAHFKIATIYAFICERFVWAQFLFILAA